MKKLLIALLLVASLAAGQTPRPTVTPRPRPTPRGTPTPTPRPPPPGSQINFPIRYGKLMTDLDANDFYIFNGHLPDYQPVHPNLNILSNNPISDIGLTVLGVSDLSTLKTYLGIPSSGTHVNDFSPVTGEFLTGFDSTSGNFSASTADYSNLTGLPQLANTNSGTTHQWLYSYNASTGNFVSSQPAFTDISGTAASTQLPTLDAILVPVANINMNGHILTNLGVPLTANDSATKTYVDSQVAAGVPPPHPPTAAATTGNVTLSGEQTIDGVSTSASRVLVKDQTTQTENGIYVTAAGAWSRATDANAGGTIPGGVFVTGGTANRNTGWACSNTLPINLGADNIKFVQVSAVPIYNPVTSVGENYLTISGQQLTAGPINLSGSNATGTLAAARFPALSGAISNTAGSLNTSLGSGVVKNSNIDLMPADTIKGNNTGSPASPLDLTSSQTKSLLSLNNVENTALSTWAGSTNISQVGTITSGTWHGNAVPVGNGGTGATNSTTALDNLLPSGSAGQIFAKTISGYQFQDQLPQVSAYGRITAQTTGHDVVMFTPVADGSFMVSVNVDSTVTGSYQVKCAYVNEDGPQTIVLALTDSAGAFVSGGTITSAGGVYQSIPAHLRAASGQGIRVYTEGTFTSGNYNADGVIQQLQ